MLKKDIHIEIRNDNWPQFVAKKAQNFFKENYLNQVFTHPYTPQENGHVESFHSILSRSIEKEAFWELDDLKNRLEKFYHTYNYKRLHGSIAHLTPYSFWNLWNEEKISFKEIKNKTLKFYLNIPYQQLPDNKSLKGVPCLNYQELDATDNLYYKVNRPKSLKKQLPIQKSPSVVSC